MDSMTPEEQEGVKCIQALLALEKQWEPEAQSLAGWRRMTDEEKELTKYAFTTFCVGGHA